MSERKKLFKMYGELATRVEDMRVIIQHNPANVPINPTDLARWEKCVSEIQRDFHSLTEATKRMVVSRNESLRDLILCPECKCVMTHEDEDFYRCDNPVCITNESMAPAVPFKMEGGV